MDTLKRRLISQVIKKFGFENENTITFCRMTENPTINEQQLFQEFSRLMNLSIELS